MGFDGLFFGKFDYQDHANRDATKTMELLWKGSANLSEYLSNRISDCVKCLRSTELAVYQYFASNL